MSISRFAKTENNIKRIVHNGNVFKLIPYHSDICILQYERKETQKLDEVSDKEPIPKGYRVKTKGKGGSDCVLTGGNAYAIAAIKDTTQLWYYNELVVEFYPVHEIFVKQLLE